jgi:ribonuclease T1
MSRRPFSEQKLIIHTLLLLLLASVVPSHVYAQTESCKAVVHVLNNRLSPKIDEQELVNILHTLNRTSNRHLPDKFITKKHARELGWRPGRDLWSIENLQGSSLGGDRFMNREHSLPENNWRELDLGYGGGHRGSKRLIFSLDGKRFVTVDHYRTFVEVPECNDR